MYVSPCPSKKQPSVRVNINIIRSMLDTMQILAIMSSALVNFMTTEQEVTSRSRTSSFFLFRTARISPHAHQVCDRGRYKGSSSMQLRILLQAETRLQVAELLKTTESRAISLQIFLMEYRWSWQRQDELPYTDIHSLPKKRRRNTEFLITMQTGDQESLSI